MANTQLDAFRARMVDLIDGPLPAGTMPAPAVLYDAVFNAFGLLDAATVTQQASNALARPVADAHHAALVALLQDLLRTAQAHGHDFSQVLNDIVADQGQK